MNGVCYRTISVEYLERSWRAVSYHCELKNLLLAHLYHNMQPGSPTCKPRSALSLLAVVHGCGWKSWNLGRERSQALLLSSPNSGSEVWAGSEQVGTMSGLEGKRELTDLKSWKALGSFKVELLKGLKDLTVWVMNGLGFKAALGSDW